MEAPSTSVDVPHVLPADGYRRDRWKNGLGWTREILRVPDSEQWHLRLSIAEIEQDAAFSVFPGIERELVLLTGEGMRLRFSDGRVHELYPPYPRVRFPGEDGVSAELVDGPTTDFNVMWQRESTSVQVLHRPMVGKLMFFTEPSVAWALHVLAGQASFDAEHGLPAMAAGDTAWLPAGQRHRYKLDGGGELLAIRVEMQPAVQ